MVVELAAEDKIRYKEEVKTPGHLCDAAICGVRRELESLAGQYAAKLAGYDRPQQEVGTVAGSDCRTVASLVQYRGIAQPVTVGVARRAAPY